MQTMGIELIRLSPQPRHMDEIVAAFDAARHGRPHAEADSAWNENGLVDGYWLGKPGIIACNTAVAPGVLLRERITA